MMIRRLLQRHHAGVVVLGVVICCAVFCGKKQSATPAIVFNADTLTTDRVGDFDPVIGNDSVRLRAVALRLVCAGQLPDSAVDSMAMRLTERLLLTSNVEWKPAAAALLLMAAERLIAGLRETDPCTGIRATADSLLQLSSKTLRVQGAVSGWNPLSCDSVQMLQTSGKAGLLSTILFVSPEIAGLLMEFVGAPRGAPPSDSADVKKLVAGLVSSPEDIAKEELRRKSAASKGAPRTTSPTGPVQVPDNSAEALRHRDQKSIRDSIEKHIPNLRQYYKKVLKTNSSLSGNVIVTIRVDAAGKVISAQVRTSEIDNRAFLDPFTEYIRTIRFKPIPPNVGAMTFDFPFEFNPEM